MLLYNVSKPQTNSKQTSEGTVAPGKILGRTARFKAFSLINPANLTGIYWAGRAERRPSPASHQQLAVSFNFQRLGALRSAAGGGAAAEAAKKITLQLHKKHTMLW